MGKVIELKKNECKFQPCNMIEGHPGPHGHAVGDGIIFAPHGGDEGIISDPIECDLLCDCCDSSMLMTKHSNGGGMFKCTNCNQCHDIDTNGQGSVTILSRLYPSNMEEGSKIQREAAVHQANEYRFGAKAKYLLDMISQSEYNSIIEKIKKSETKWCEEHPLKIPWYRRLLTLDWPIGAKN